MTMKLVSLTLGVSLLLHQYQLGQHGQNCNSNMQSTAPTNGFIEHGNGTLTDTRTGLMWKKCLEGQEGSNCFGQTQRDAVGRCRQ